MGSPVDLQLRAESPEAAEIAFRAVLEEVERVEQLLSDYRPMSELSRINRNAHSAAVTVDPEMFSILADVISWQAHTSGAFDPSIGALVDLWGFRSGEFQVPPPDSLRMVLGQSGTEHIRLDSLNRTVEYLVRGLRLDPGAFGKGYALDRSARILANLGVESALLGIGRSSYLALGPPPGESPWRILPDSAHPEIAIELRDQALATSGASERSFLQDGLRYGHILDPRTGMPADIVGPVTVVAESAFLSDILSTALYVTGPDLAETAVSEWPAKFSFRFRDHPAASPPGRNVY